MSLDLSREAGRILTMHPYAGGLSSDLAKVLSLCTERSLATDEVLTAEGDQGDEAYFLLRGSVRVMKKGPEDDDQELAQIAAPSLLGHMSLVDHSRRSATCVATMPCLVLVLDRPSYGSLLREASARGTALRRLLLSSLTRQLISGNARLQDLLVEPEMTTSSGSSSPAQAQEQASRPAATTGRDISEEDLLKAAGVLEGWSLDTAGVERVASVEDEHMRRLRWGAKPGV